MSISGFGSPVISRNAPTSSGRLNAPDRAAASGGNDFDSLTGSDHELIHQATGQRIEPGFDAHTAPFLDNALTYLGSRGTPQLDVRA